MLPEISYSINGKPCSGKEYLDLVEEVFTRADPDVEHIKLQNGEVISLGGNEACVSILHHKHDGTIWTPSIPKNTKKDVVTLLGAFVQGDEAILSSYGAILSSGERHKGINVSEGSKIDERLKRLFLVFLALAVINGIIWGLARARSVFLLPVFLFSALACVCFMIGGIARLIDTYRYLVKSFATDKKSYASWQMAIMYCVSTFSIIGVLVFFVLFPVYLVAFLVGQGLRILGAG